MDACELICIAIRYEIDQLPADNKEQVTSNKQILGVMKVFYVFSSFFWFASMTVALRYKKEILTKSKNVEHIRNFSL